MTRELDFNRPGRLMASGGTFDEVMAALDELLAQVGEVDDDHRFLAGCRVTFLSHFERPAEEQAAALDEYLALAPKPIDIAAKVLAVCVHCPALCERYLPVGIAAISPLPRTANVAALLERLKEVQSET
ncbi:hypothetical protein [Haliangium sp.]|uniref:hypothetical protein n=1 Tax=Haliangium sp. TaxID=2663208 RepID=UPI003D13EBD6